MGALARRTATRASDRLGEHALRRAGLAADDVEAHAGARGARRDRERHAALHATEQRVLERRDDLGAHERARRIDAGGGLDVDDLVTLAAP
jgi:hypothetical protein